MLELKTILQDISKKDFRDTRETFAITFLTCNRDKRTGGEFIVLESANACGLPPTCKGLDMRGILDNNTGKRYAVHSRLIYDYNGEGVYWR